MYSNETCLDFDECKKENSNKLSQGYVVCGAKAFCSNTAGGYACLCKYGFIEDTDPIGGNESYKTTDDLIRELTRCRDIDECIKKNSCPEKSKCENSEGSYHCNCFDGFGGDHCNDIDECNSTNSCDVNAKCLNTYGSYVCSCEEGYFGTGSWCSPGQCQDINCPENQKCVLPTTTDCECMAGFRPNNASVCFDINECEEINCDDRAECFNTLGTYVCRELQNSTTASANSALASTQLPTTKEVLVTTKSMTTKRPIPKSFR